jgi:hypothetical protein
MDDRQERALSDAEVAEKIAERKKAEAEAELADERVMMSIIGGAAFGVLGLLVCGWALLVQGDIVIGTFGAGIGMVGFGVITVAQWLRMRGGSA